MSVGCETDQFVAWSARTLSTDLRTQRSKWGPETDTSGGDDDAGLSARKAVAPAASTGERKLLWAQQREFRVKDSIPIEAGLC